MTGINRDFYLFLTSFSFFFSIYSFSTPSRDFRTFEHIEGETFSFDIFVCISRFLKWMHEEGGILARYFFAAYPLPPMQTISVIENGDNVTSRL